MEKRIIQHGSEIARARFHIAQIRPSDVTGKKRIARKQSYGSARLEQTQTNAVGRMTRCCDNLYFHIPDSYSVTVFDVAVGKGSGCSLGKQNGRTGSGRQLGMASYEIRVRMRQKNIPQFEPVFGEIGQVPVYIPFWVDYNSFSSDATR